MPIEIRELVIRTEIGGKAANLQPSPSKSSVDADKLVQDAIDKVLEVIKNKEER
jgi:hypothetical protein